MINIKDLYNVFKEAGKIDEYQKILDLIDDSFRKRDEIETLREENKKMNTELEIAETAEEKILNE